MAQSRAIVITGPTGTGKTELAVEVALRVGAEIISADSRQIYRYMDVGTAKPSGDLRERVPHHGLDLLNPDEHYSAGRFARHAWRWIEEAHARGRGALIVGGTGFFIRALLAPLGPEPDSDPRRRARLRDYLGRRPIAELRRWLARIDPQRAAQLEREGGPQRLGRSLEVALLSGRRHSWWLSRPAETPALEAPVVCLRLPREELYRRIEGRLDRMLAQGFLDEVRRLWTQYGDDAPGLKSVGYVELISHRRGERSLAEAVEAAKRGTRRFARRQVTWFRHQLPPGTLWLSAELPRRELVDEIVRLWMPSDGRASSEPRSPIASSD
ncbi:MAG: tRNA (adenosine(37)-N6)-dimethylallyltransferase MiaA [Gemmatimonadota bacterium]|nr:MAG: tRNA (adenosine(37)-N6)-dimethylallyltransferase MiaA [Gemmatimonadota bacterium]